MGDIVAREIHSLRGKVWTLSGPSFAREVARGVHTGLMLGGPAGAQVGWTFAWCAGLLIVFFPLALRGYIRRS
jgi:hypothetical protein